MKILGKKSKPLKETFNAYATVEQLAAEQATRANSDDLINTNVKIVAKDCKNIKDSFDELLYDKQDTTDLKLDTNSKTIVGAINEVNLKFDAKAEDQVSKDYLDEQILEVQYKVDDYIRKIKESIIVLETTSYKKIKEIVVNSKEYLFDEYDENYSYLFVFEFNNMLKRNISGVLERPSGLSSEVNSQNVLLDFSATNSTNMMFTPSTKILEAQDWGQVRKVIYKIHIYRKK